MNLTPEKYILKRRGLRRAFEVGTIDGLDGDSSQNALITDQSEPLDTESGDTLVYG
jgi:hypothetical protein